jgi:hypothetical protein
MHIKTYTRITYNRHQCINTHACNHNDLYIARMYIYTYVYIYIYIYRNNLEI